MSCIGLSMKNQTSLEDIVTKQDEQKAVILAKKYQGLRAYPVETCACRSKRNNRKIAEVKSGELGLGMGEMI